MCSKIIMIFYNSKSQMIQCLTHGWQKLLLMSNFDEVEIDEDEVQDDEVQIIDTLAPVLREEEGESNLLVPTIETKAQDVDMTEEQLKVKVMLIVQDEKSENPKVKIDLEAP